MIVKNKSENSKNVIWNYEDLGGCHIALSTRVGSPMAGYMKLAAIGNNALISVSGPGISTEKGHWAH